MKNYVLNSLAIVGAISLIIMACSTDSPSENTSRPTTPTLAPTIGKYQISTTVYSATEFLDVIDTQTGIIKTYSRLATNYGTYSLVTTTNTQP
jgi:hypothetical protein